MGEVRADRAQERLGEPAGQHAGAAQQLDGPRPRDEADRPAPARCASGCRRRAGTGPGSRRSGAPPPSAKRRSPVSRQARASVTMCWWRPSSQIHLGSRPSSRWFTALQWSAGQRGVGDGVAVPVRVGPHDRLRRAEEPDPPLQQLLAALAGGVARPRDGERRPRRRRARTARAPRRGAASRRRGAGRPARARDRGPGRGRCSAACRARCDVLAGWHDARALQVPAHARRYERRHRGHLTRPRSRPAPRRTESRPGRTRHPTVPRPVASR